ncbi:MAG: SRPBCC family protein [Micrococcales bacterium]
MITIRLTLQLPQPIDVVWSELTDWAANSKWIPQTVVTVTKETGGVGTEFVGVSKAGPIELVDRMRVTVSMPPSGEFASARVEKVGPVLFGEAGFDLKANQGGTTLVWFETVSLKSAALTTIAKPFLTPVAWVLFRFALGGFARTLNRQ